MAASKQEIEMWFDQGVKENKTHMIVVCDTYEWEDYPIYVSKSENAAQKVAANNGVNMQKIMEVYDLRKDKATQLAAHRVWNI